MLAGAQKRRNAKQQIGTLLDAGLFPTLESLRCRLHCAVRQFLRGFMKTADHLCTIGGVDAVEFAPSSNTFAANYQWILPAQFTRHFLKRSPHSLRILFLAEVSERFVAKFCWHIESPDFYCEFRIADCEF